MPVCKPVDGNRSAFACAVAVEPGVQQRLAAELGPRLVRMVASVETALEAQVRLQEVNPVREVGRLRRRPRAG